MSHNKENSSNVSVTNEAFQLDGESSSNILALNRSDPPSDLNILTHTIQSPNAILSNAEINIYKSENVVLGSVTHIHGSINVNQQIIIDDRQKNIYKTSNENGSNGITLTEIYCKELEENATNMNDDFNMIPYESIPTSYLRLITRSEWFARPTSGSVDELKPPVSYVVISHTATEPCLDRITCLAHMRYMQNMHMNNRKWSDIAYNFVIGGDGAVYEGRGWNIAGSHTLGHNKNSIGIGVIGTYSDIVPSEKQLTAIKKLLEISVQQKKLAEDYKLYGHRQLRPSESPGDKLFAEIQNWPHFSHQLPEY